MGFNLLLLDTNELVIAYQHGVRRKVAATTWRCINTAVTKIAMKSN
jgi:hypothetical protein